MFDDCYEEQKLTLLLIEGVHVAQCRIGALSGEESVLVCVGKCLRISSTFLAEGCVHSPYQVESQVAKLSPTLACFIQQCKGTLSSEKWDEVRITYQEKS